MKLEFVQKTNLIKIVFELVTSRSYFDKMNSTLGSVVPLTMFHEKVALAASAVLNGWILTQANSTDHCWLRFVSFSFGKLIIIIKKKR